jgi:hypothetical protein
MPGSGILDLAIGLAFVFGVTAALSSVITELIARFLGLRAAYLLSGLRELLDGGAADLDLGQAQREFHSLRAIVRGAPSAAVAAAAAAAAAGAPAAARAPSAAGALLGGPILRNQGMTGQISSRKLTTQGGQPPKMADGKGRTGWRQRRTLPSYIPARSFAEAVMDLLVPDAAGHTTMDAIGESIGRLPASMSTLKLSLQSLAKNAGNDIAAFRTSVEHWYDDHMDRVSGWYKRYVAKITLVAGAVLVLLLNINALTIGRTLYTDSAVNTAVSSVAARTTNCAASPSTQTCLKNLQGQLSTVAQAGLPVGWATVRDCAPLNARCNWLDQRGIFSRHGGSAWRVVLVLIGFLITIIALVPGARFWFGLLSKLGSLRTTGPKPAAPAS